MAALPTEKAPNLLTPCTLGDVKLRNKIVMAPLTRGRADDNDLRDPNARMVDYYAARAEYAGMIITEATTVNAWSANGWVQSPGIYTESQTSGWAKCVEAVHAKECPIVMQLWHLGRAAHSSFLGGKMPVSASAICINGNNFGNDGTYDASNAKVPWETPTEMTIEEIDKCVADYRAAAVFAKQAGFDAIEVHAANGYLLNTFIDSSTNVRTDEYGGSVFNRYRFLNRVLDVCLEVFPASQIGVRLSPNGVFNDMGAPDSIETYTYGLRMLSGRNLAYVHVMDGLGFGFHKKSEPFTIEAMRKEYTGNLMCNVGYDRDSGEAVLAKGDANAVCIGRPFISNPDLPYRYAHDLPIAESDPATWFSHDDKGYNDYPKYEGTSDPK